MPRKLLLNWDKSNKVWYKTIDAKKIYFGAGKWKYRDKTAYDKAVLKYKQHLIDNGLAAKPKKKQGKRAVTSTKRSQLKKGTLAHALDEYMLYETTRYNLKQITNNRLAVITYVISFFSTWLGDNLHMDDGLKQINSKKFNSWYQHLEKRVTGKSVHTRIGNKRYGPINWRTANSYFQIVKGFFNWLYIEQEWIDSIPRNFHTKKFRKPKHYDLLEKHTRKRFIYEVDEIKSLLKSSNDKYPMRLWILLGLNCGMTAIDITTMTEANLVRSDDGKLIYIVKDRKKTGVRGEWILWQSTADELNRWIDQRNNDAKWSALFSNTSLLFLNKTGTPLTNDILTGSGLTTKAGSSTTIQYHYRKLRNEVFSDDAEARAIPFKCLRKTGATWINRLNKSQSELLEQLYLAHKPSTTSRKDYIFLDKHELTEALLEIEQQINLGDYDAD